MVLKLAKTGENQEFSHAALELGLLQLPGGCVRDEDGVESRRKGRIDVAARAVPHHPATGLNDAMLAHQPLVSGYFLLSHNLDGLEESLEARALGLRGLFGGLTLGEENQPVALGKVGERLGYALEDMRGCLLERPDHPVHVLYHFAPGHVPRELQIRLFEGSPEAAHSVAVLADVRPLSLVQDPADVVPGESEWLHLGDKLLDALLKEDVVLPKGIVGINEQRLARHGRLSLAGFFRVYSAARRS